jgi:hypothetical protein
MKALIEKLFPQMAKATKEQIIKDLKDWPPVDPLLDPSNTAAQQTQKLSDRAVAQESLATKSEG